MAAPPRKIALWIVIAALFVGAYYAGWYRSNHRHDAFAKCLASKQVKMYGLYWCPHCADQKAMFGKSFEYVPYVECAIHGSKDLARECTSAGVKLFPAWQFAGGAPQPGVLSLDDLSLRSGCALP
jgi:hypothetical protein